MHGKPVVVVVLDQESWNLLTVPGGAQQAWELNKWGAPLAEYRGQEIIPGHRFNLCTVESLFAHLSAINLCPCRPMDETNAGISGIVNRLTRYVQHDLCYFKAHAELKTLAAKWQQSGNRAGLLLDGSEEEKWSRWIDISEAAMLAPPPSDAQKEFVRASRSNSQKIRRRILAVGLLLILLIVAGGVVSSIMAYLAVVARDEAVRESAANLVQLVHVALRTPLGTGSALSLSEARLYIKVGELADVHEHAPMPAVPYASCVSCFLSGCSHAVFLLYAAPVRVQVSKIISGLNRPYLAYLILGSLRARMSQSIMVETATLETGREFDLSCVHVSHLTGEVAAAYGDNRLLLWKLGQTRDRVELKLETDNGTELSWTAVAWSPLEKDVLLAGASDGHMVLWNTANREADAVIDGPQTSPAVLLWGLAAPDQVVYFSDGSLEVFIRDLRLPTARKLLEHSSAVTYATMSSDGSMVAATDYYGGIQIANILSETTITLMEPSRPADEEGSGKSTLQFVLAFSPDSKRLMATEGFSEMLYVFDSGTGEIFMRDRNGIRGTSASWSPADSDIVAVGNDKGDIHLLNMDRNSRNWRQGVQSMYSNTFPADVRSLQWAPASHPEGSYVLVAGMTTGYVHVWHYATGVDTEMKTSRSPTGMESVSCRSSSALEDDGALRILANNGTNYRLYEADSTGFVTNPWSSQVYESGHSKAITVIVWSPAVDGVFASGADDGTVRIHYDNTDEAEALQLQPDMDQVVSLAWSSDGAMIAAGGRKGEVRVWWGDLSTMRGSQQQHDEVESVLLEGHDDRVKALAWSPNRAVLASSAGDGLVNLWQPADAGSPLLQSQTFGTPGSIEAVEFLAWSPDGQAIAAGTIPGRVYLWDVAETLVNRKPRDSSPQLLHMHGSRVAAGAWLQTIVGGQGMVVTGHDDGAVIVWDLKDGQRIMLGDVGTAKWVSPCGDRAQTIAVAGETSGVWLMRRLDWRLKDWIAHLEAIALSANADPALSKNDLATFTSFQLDEGMLLGD